MNFYHISSTKKHYILLTHTDGIFYIPHSALGIICTDPNELKISIEFKKYGTYERIYNSQALIEHDLKILLGEEEANTEVWSRTDVKN